MTRPTTLETYRTWLSQLSDDELKAERAEQSTLLTKAMVALSEARQAAEHKQRWAREVQAELLHRMPEEDPPF